MWKLRRAQASDAVELSAVAHAAKRHWGYDEALIELWRPDLTVTPADIESDLVWCAELEDRIAGFCSASGDGEAWEIEHMWVLPEHIGKGVGRALFEHMLEELRARGARTLRIESDPNAAGFYERMGARRIGDVPATPKGRTLPLFGVRLLSPRKVPGTF